MPDLLKSVSVFGSSAYQANKNIDRLSIQLRLNGFSFCISNPEESQIVFLKEFKIVENSKQEHSWQNLVNIFEDWLIQNKWSSEQFKETIIILDTQNFTILPSSFSDGNKNHLDFNQKIDYPFFVLKNEISKTQLELFFPIQKSLHSVIKDYFPNASIKHLVNEINGAFLNQANFEKPENLIIAHVSERNLYLMTYKNGKLTFQNCYQYTSKEDFIYFILLIYNNQHLNPLSDKLLLIGEINPSSALYNICYQYIRHIKLQNQINNLDLNNEFDSLPIHQYYVQLNSAI